MAKIGRPTRFDELKAAKLIGQLRSGIYLEQAAASVGIARSTFYAWRRIGREERDRREADRRHKGNPELDRFVEFIEAVEKAEAEAEIEAVTLIKKASVKVWQAGAWLLERKFPQRWGRRDRAEIPAKGSGDAEAFTLQDLIGTIDTKSLTKDEKKAMVYLLRKAWAGPDPSEPAYMQTPGEPEKKGQLPCTPKTN